jgi:hypothetical protein
MTAGSPVALWIFVLAIVLGLTGAITSAGLYVRLRRALRALERRSMRMPIMPIEVATLQRHQAHAQKEQRVCKLYLCATDCKWSCRWCGIMSMCTASGPPAEKKQMIAVALMMYAFLATLAHFGSSCAYRFGLYMKSSSGCEW